MPYRQTQRLLQDQDDLVLVESAFKETTRSGAHRASVLLALTKKKLLIVSRKLERKPCVQYNRLEVPLGDVELTIFKQTRRQVLKASFRNKTVKYFEIGNFNKRKIFWDIWCNHVRELTAGPRLWPFNTAVNVWTTTAGTSSCVSTDNFDQDLGCNQDQNKSEEPMTTKRCRWTDKHLYLGSKREHEDMNRPSPVAGIAHMTLEHFLKEFYGYSDESIDIQKDKNCDDLQFSLQRESPNTTYGGDYTANVAYMSILASMRGDADDSSMRRESLYSKLL